MTRGGGEGAREELDAERTEEGRDGGRASASDSQEGLAARAIEMGEPEYWSPRCISRGGTPSEERRLEPVSESRGDVRWGTLRWEVVPVGREVLGWEVGGLPPRVLLESLNRRPAGGVPLSRCATGERPSRLELDMLRGAWR